METSVRVAKSWVLFLGSSELCGTGTNLVGNGRLPESRRTELTG
jgi:hypothetical protein